MKRKLSILLMAALCLTMMFALSGCGGTKPTSVVGTWSVAVDVGDTLNQRFQSVDAQLAEALKVDNFYVDMLVTFDEDGIYYMNVDSASVAKGIESVMDTWTNGIKAYLTREYEAVGLDFEAEMAKAGVSIDELAQRHISDIDVESILGTAAMNGGCYKVEGDKIFFGASPSMDTETADSVTFEFVKNGMKFKSATNESVKSLMPITLTVYVAENAE